MCFSFQMNCDMFRYFFNVYMPYVLFFFSEINIKNEIIIRYDMDCAGVFNHLTSEFHVGS